jgi:hypothetical protein
LVPAITETSVTTPGTDATGVKDELTVEKLLIPEAETEAIVKTYPVPFVNPSTVVDVVVKAL